MKDRIRDTAWMAAVWLIIVWMAWRLGRDLMGGTMKLAELIGGS